MAKNVFCTRRKQASSGDHVKNIFRIFLWVDQKGIFFLGSGQLSLFKSDIQSPIYSLSISAKNGRYYYFCHFSLFFRGIGQAVDWLSVIRFKQTKLR